MGTASPRLIRTSAVEKFGTCAGGLPLPSLCPGLGGSTYYVRYCSGAAEADCFATPFYDFNDAISDGSALSQAKCTLDAAAALTDPCTCEIELTATRM